MKETARNLLKKVTGEKLFRSIWRAKERSLYLLGILRGKEKYLSRQIKCKTIEFGDPHGSFPVAVRDSSNWKVIYSFGVGTDTSFDRDILAYSKEAEIYAFDPTPSVKKWIEQQPIFHDERYHFYECGISSKNGFQEFYLPKNNPDAQGSLVGDMVENNGAHMVQVKKLKQIMDEFGHSQIDILKMDIEGTEFEVIPDALQDECNILQICLEVHDRFLPNGKKILKEMCALLNEHSYFIAGVNSSGHEMCFVRKA